jgi:hypothetical protein
VPFPTVPTYGNVVNIDPETEKFDIRNRVQNAGVHIDPKGALPRRQFHFSVFVSFGQKSPLEFVDDAFLENLLAAYQPIERSTLRAIRMIAAWST